MGLGSSSIMKITYLGFSTGKNPANDPRYLLVYKPSMTFFAVPVLPAILSPLTCANSPVPESLTTLSKIGRRRSNVLFLATRLISTGSWVEIILLSLSTTCCTMKGRINIPSLAKAE